MSKLNRPLWLLLLAAIGMNSGCSQLSSRPDGGEPAKPQTATEPEPPSEDAVNASLPHVELTPTLLYRLLVADFASESGDYQLAAEQYLIAADETHDPRLAKWAARTAMYGNDSVTALRAATMWQGLAPEDRQADQALAAIYINKGQLNEARPHLLRIIQTPKGSQGYLVVANLLSHAPNHEQALAMMDELVRPHSQNPDALFASASLAAQLEKPALALERLDQLLRIEPHHLQGLIMKSRLLYAMDRKEEGLATLQRAVNEAPNNTQLRTVYARMLVDEQRLEDARHQFQIVDRQSPNDPDVIYALGLLDLQANDFNDGEKQFQRLLDLGQHEAEANLNLGQIAESRNEIDKAIDYYEAVNEGDNELDAHLRAAMLIARRDGVDKGLDYLHKLHPGNAADNVKVSLFEGELLHKAGRNEESMSVYNDALDRYPENPELLYARAMMAERMNRLDILEQDLRTILRKNPNDAQALNALGYTLADRSIRLDEARQLIEKAMKLSPNDAAILDSMGWVLYKQGHNAEALGYLKQALALQNDPEIAAHLGEVMWASGQRDEARKVWDNALKQAPDNQVLRRTIDRLTK